MAESRGSIGFSSTYRPPVPLDIFSCLRTPTSEQDELPMTDGVCPRPPTSEQDELPMTDGVCPRPPTSDQDERRMTDGVNYNYNGQVISSAALKTILNREEFVYEGKEADINSGPLSGMVFVSERQEGLELLHIALCINDNLRKVFCLADVFGKGNFSGVRMEDSGCIAGDNLIYVTTMDPAPRRRQPWTAVYKTNLKTGKTDRLTPSGEADLSPSVAPSGTKIAVASFQGKRRGWDGEIEDLQTDIFVMNVEKPPNRHKVVSNGGWPTWGNDNVIFFHRKDGNVWGVFRFDLSNGTESPVTPKEIQAMTPAAIDDNTVVVATIRQESKFSDTVREVAQYRHIEIFDSTKRQQPKQITQKTNPMVDHFNPFVIDGGERIGYHRCKNGDDIPRNSNKQSGDDIPRNSNKLESPYPDVGLFRVPGIFPTFSNDGSKLAFVDNEFKTLWVADSTGLHKVYTARGPDSIFSPVWDKKKDKVYACMGPSFQSDQTLDIYAIDIESNAARVLTNLTEVSNNASPSTSNASPIINNAFPSTNEDGTRLVFRSTRDGGDKRYKNLYIMEATDGGQFDGGKITRLTEGPWTDTHCQWAPKGDWIVFSSNRGKPEGARKSDNGLDPGYFAVFLVKANDSKVIVRVMASGNDFAGHVNHPFFSPDGKSIVVTADLAAVSVDPISLPLFLHSVRPYGDIFTFDIDPANINKNKNVKKFNRITHSRYENSTAAWTKFSTQASNAAWNKIINEGVTPSCPYAQDDEVKNWRHKTGHLCISERCC